MSRFRFTAGPWNVNEGVEAFGPGVRPTVDLEEKFKKFAEIGLAGVQFHDDDAVPDMNNMTEAQIIDYAKDVKASLDLSLIHIYYGQVLQRQDGYVQNYRHHQGDIRRSAEPQ